ncbi:MAG: ubiquinol-cytochrome C chaperone [Proteobacteria bacterium]|nr:ubiquinol-cytochrome C chaperone [Pseudomonadota bacterium]
MLQWLRKRTETGRRAGELYGSVVTAARQPDFYGNIGVPDTPEGRFELVALHLFLAIESLGGPASDVLRQRLIEVFVTDMDDCMREMGVGDLAVPKKVKRAAAAFYERATAYRRALAAGDEFAMAERLQHYIFANPPPQRGGSEALAHYVHEAASALSVQSFDAWLECGFAARSLERSVSIVRMTAT